MATSRFYGAVRTATIRLWCISRERGCSGRPGRSPARSPASMFPRRVAELELGHCPGHAELQRRRTSNSAAALAITKPVTVWLRDVATADHVGRPLDGRHDRRQPTKMARSIDQQV